MYKSIRKRLTIIFLTLAMVPLFLVGIILTLKTYTVQEQEAVALQREVAKHLSSRMLAFVKELESTLRLVLELQNFQTLDRQEQKQILSIILARKAAFDELILLDAAGRETVYLSRLKFYHESTPGQKMDSDAFRVPMSESVTYHGPVRFEETTGEPLMIMAVPAYNLRTGSTEGVLVADIRIKEIWNLVARLRPGPRGDSYIVDAQNRVVAHRNPSVVLRGTRFDPPNQDGIDTGLNGDRAVLVSEAIELGDQRFRIVVENPVSEALALAIETIWVIVCALVVLAGVAGGLGIVAVRRIVHPIQELAGVARQIQAGQLNKQATVHTRDEIGELSKAFNSMTRKLTESMESLRKEVGERKRAQEALLESEEKYRVLFQSFPLGISITDKDGNIREVNTVSESILEISSMEHTGRSYGSPEWKVIRSDGSPMPISEFAGVLAKRENRTVENVEMGIVKENGEITWLNVTAAPIPLAGYGEAITYQDVTRRKEIEMELERHREHLEEIIKERSHKLEAAQDELLKREKLAVLGQLTATVSHELRNPLGVIRSSAFYLRKKLQRQDEKVDKHLARIDDQIGVCDMIVEDLLEYTRGKQSERVPVEFKPWLEDVLNQFATPEKIELVRGIAADLPAVSMDRMKMQRVMINLLNNAILAVSGRWEAEIGNEGDGLYRPRLRVAARSAPEDILIEVEDNGVGMDDVTLRKAFDPLFTTRARGTGLGLAIVRKIVAEHGGSVSIESEPNQGTKVTVVLPV